VDNLPKLNSKRVKTYALANCVFLFSLIGRSTALVLLAFDICVVFFFQAHQREIEEEIKSKQDRASRAKLESEMKELQKVRSTVCSTRTSCGGVKGNCLVAFPDFCGNGDIMLEAYW